MRRRAVPQYRYVDLGVGFQPTAINIHDQIVGCSGDTGLVWENGHTYRPDDLVPHLQADGDRAQRTGLVRHGLAGLPPGGMRH
jgi:hypothetical protein